MKSFGAFVTGRRTAWVVLLVCLVALGLALALVPRPSSTAIANPATAGDSRSVAQFLAHVPADNLTHGLVVWTTTDGSALSASEQSAVRTDVAAVAALSKNPKAAYAQPSPDRSAVLSDVSLATPAVLADAPSAASRIMRVASAGLPSDIRVRLTGPLASDVAIAHANEAASSWQLLVALILVVAVLLILATRSLLLWLVPLVLDVAVASLAQLLASNLAIATGLPLTARAGAIVFALTLGVATAYSIRFVLRFRAALRAIDDRREAACRAWSATGFGIVVSGILLLVGSVVALFATNAAVVGLAVGGMVGVVLAAVISLFAVPAALVEFGRRGFWPSSLAPVTAAGAGARPLAFAHRHSILVAFVTAVVVAALTTTVGGLVLAATAPTPDAQAKAARATIDHAFLPGYGNQSVIIVPNSLKGETSVVAPTTLAMNLPNAHSVTVGSSFGGRAVLFADFDIDPGSAKSFATLTTLRRLITKTGGPTATSLVGGPDAAALDRSTAASYDFGVLLPIAVVLMLALLLFADLIERRRKHNLVV